MARRIGAIAGMLVLIGLALILVWRVHLHREEGRPREEPALVSFLGANRTPAFRA